MLEKSPAAKIHAAHADLADLGEVVRMANSLNALLPRLDVLLNNAGVYMAERKSAGMVSK